MSNKTETTYLSIKEACHELRVCKATLYNRISDGTIQPIKLGRRTLITRASILALGVTA